MGNNSKNILLAELYSSYGYCERIFHALLDVSDLGKKSETKEIGVKLTEKLHQFFTETIYRLSPDQISKQSLPANLSQVKSQFNTAKNALEALIQAEYLETQFLAETAVQFINLTYATCYEFHKIISAGSDLEVQLPRVGLVDIHYYNEDGQEKSFDTYQFDDLDPECDLDDDHMAEYDEDLDLNLENYNEEEFEEELELPFFFLKLETVQNAISQKQGEITCLEWQRNKKYQDLIQEGHEAIFKKHHEKALGLFKKALNYIETAEALTLIGWSFSLLKNLDEAKSYCMKAISLDPNYGPPYNDLGSYLLSEGQVGESLKWFELAKKAVNYQNREYPYINAGRAYMSRNEYDLALSEFSKALTLAPFHEELHITVEKLKRSLKKDTRLPADLGQNKLKEKLKDDLDDAPPPH